MAVSYSQIVGLISISYTSGYESVLAGGSVRSVDTVLVLKIAKVVLVLGAAGYVVSQVRKPDRFAGRLFAMLMNHSHSKLTDWGLMHTRVKRISLSST